MDNNQVYITEKEYTRNILRNPLVVFGLVLIAGDGPLVIAYILTTDNTRNITSSTVDIILKTMNKKKIIIKKYKNFYLSEKGVKLMKSINEYLNKKY